MPPRSIGPEHVTDDPAMVRTERLTTRNDAQRRGGAKASTFLQPGREVDGRYHIEKLLGIGGTSRVWLAHDVVEGRRLALKEIEAFPDVHYDEAEESVLMVRREFFAMKRLRHPFTLKVYDCGVLPSGNRYITMERVDGEDVNTRVHDRPLASNEAFDLLMRIAQTLAFIHARLFVHCDIKADNIRLLPNGDIKLMDFGLMHQLGTPTAGRLWGTAAYIAPEWLVGSAIDGRADLYSLGILGFFAVTGRYPFDGTTVTEILRAQRDEPPPAPSSIVPSIDPELESIILRLLAKDPARRYPNANGLIVALAKASDAAAFEEPLGCRASYLHVPTVVGRKHESACLMDALQAAERGQARAVFIAAPAGTGKSRLLAELELQAKLADVTVAFGQCHAEGVAPLTPLKHALRFLIPITPPEMFARISGPLAPLFAPEYANSEGFARAPQEGKLIVFEALAQWLTELAKVRRFVLAFEDLHWADDATIEHLNVIVHALHGTRGLVCGTLRSDELTFSPLYHTVFAGAAEILKLPPLSHEQLRELVSLALPGFDVPRTFIDNLYGTTGGNVFFATECLRALVERGALSRLHGEWHAHADLGTIALPSSIGEVIRQRLSTLSQDQLAFLRRAAPAGRILDMALVRAAGELSEEKLFLSLEEAVERQFLQYADGTYHFAHDTVHETIYAATPALEQRLYHGRIAEYLDRTVGGSPAGARAVGYHFARSLEPARAIAPLLFAAQHLLANSGMLEGYRILKEAEALLEKHPNYPNRTELQVPALGKLIETGYSCDTPKSFVFASKLFSYWDRTLDLDAGREIAHRRMLTEPRKAFREIPVHAHMSAEEAFLKRSEYRILQCMALAIMGRLTDFQSAIDRADTENDKGSPFRAAAHIAGGGGLLHHGHFVSLVQEMKEHLAVLRAFRVEKPGGPTRLYWALAMGSYFLNLMSALMGNDLDPRATSDAIEIADELGIPEIRIYHLLSLVVRAAVIGDASQFDRYHAELNDRMRRVGNPPLPERNLAIFTPVYSLERCDIELATAIVQRGAQISEKVMPGDAWLKLYVAVYRGCLLVLRKEYDAARPALSKAITDAHARDFRLETFALVYMSRLEQALGNVGAARESAELALARATSAVHANRFDEILARRALAAVLPGPAGDEQLEIARELASDSGNVLQLGITLLTLSERRASRHPGGASALRALAQKHLKAAGARVWLEKALASNSFEGRASRR
ncbi:protein kinase [Pendulispora rubella]|uniref:Protein kinase n=1 Tax=Pendulispora rubella TaxID=2741070 RepID=A0ABZ2L251_9BACT